MEQLSKTIQDVEYLLGSPRPGFYTFGVYCPKIREIDFCNCSTSDLGWSPAPRTERGQRGLVSGPFVRLFHARQLPNQHHLPCQGARQGPNRPRQSKENQLGDEVDLDLLVELRAGRESKFLIGELRYDKDESAHLTSPSLTSHHLPCQGARQGPTIERDTSFVDNLLVQIHFIIEVIGLEGFATCVSGDDLLSSPAIERLP